MQSLGRTILRLSSSVVTTTLDGIIDEATRLYEELQATRRDPIARLERRVRERVAPLARDVLRARRERKARDREHTMKNVVAPPRKSLSTRLRHR